MKVPCRFVEEGPGRLCLLSHLRSGHCYTGPGIPRRMQSLAILWPAVGHIIATPQFLPVEEQQPHAPRHIIMLWTSPIANTSPPVPTHTHVPTLHPVDAPTRSRTGTPVPRLPVSTSHSQPSLHETPPAPAVSFASGPRGGDTGPRGGERGVFV